MEQENHKKPEFRNIITNPLKNLLFQNILHQDFNTGELFSEINKAYDNLPEPIVKAINSMDAKYAIEKIITVEVTTKKKGRVIATDLFNTYKLDDLIEFEEYIISSVYHKQVIALNVIEPGNMVVVNMKPKKFCCDTLKQQFSFCKDHGVYCPDYFIRYNNVRQNGYTVHALNAQYQITNCPFCGSLLKEDNE